jgi:redox-sensitive bicupin YhaK (pirin superfamily)
MPNMNEAKGSSMKKVLFKQKSEIPHWVGDGFPVRSIFTYHENPRDMSPFLLLDYAGPTEFSPSEDHVRGVGEHPHRGFETVTIVYSGEVEHRDSAGGGGLIGPGDVQWMTAASGLVHEEKHGKEFAKKGGSFEMVQLWVNLPHKNKMAAPRYQGIKDADIPRVDLGEKGWVRVIAGDFEGHRGPAQTFTPINLWDLRLRAGAKQVFRVPKGHSTTVFVLSGEVRIGEDVVTEAEIAVLEKDGEEFTLSAAKDSKILVMGGEPIAEPIVGYGPFVMTSPEEIHQAFQDFEAGKMGRMR